MLSKEYKGWMNYLRAEPAAAAPLWLKRDVGYAAPPNNLSEH